MYNKLENSHHTFCKLIDSSKTDLQRFLDDENRYVLERKKRGKNMLSRKALVKWVPYFDNTFATIDSSK
jgi:hypothetical protein